MISVRQRASPSGASAEIRELARAVERLVPCWRNPERFFAARDELAERLHQAAQALDQPSAGAVPKARAS